MTALFCLLSVANGLAQPSRSAAEAYWAAVVQTPGFHARVAFPPRVTEGPPLTYRLGAQQTLELLVEAAAGPESRFPIELSGAVLVEGAQKVVRVAGAPGRRRTFALSLRRPGEVARARVRIAAAELRPGASTGVVLLWQRGAPPFPGWTFTVKKGDGPFAARPSFPGGRRGRATGQAGSRTTSCDGNRGPPSRPDSQGAFCLRVAVEAPETTEDSLPVSAAIVALLDGATVPVSGLALAHLSVGAGTSLEVPVEVRGLPRDGLAHELAIYLVSGDGQPSELAPGRPHPSYRPPQRIAVARW